MLNPSIFFFSIKFHASIVILIIYLCPNASEIGGKKKGVPPLVIFHLLPSDSIASISNAEMEIVQNDMDPMLADKCSDEKAHNNSYSIVDNSGESHPCLLDKLVDSPFKYLL